MGGTGNVVSAQFGMSPRGRGASISNARANPCRGWPAAGDFQVEAALLPLSGDVSRLGTPRPIGTNRLDWYTCGLRVLQAPCQSPHTGHWGAWWVVCPRGM
jgi:hypothetical protein